MASLKEHLRLWIDGLNPYDPNGLQAQEGLAPLAVEESGIKTKATRVILVAIIAFGAWAALAPLDAGVNVPGTVVVMGNRKAVQHPSGGVVEEVLVREGATVKAGEVLLRINPLNTQSQLTSADLDYVNALATESRLVAERLGKSSITWMPELGSKTLDARTSEAIHLQQQLFQSRRDEFRQQQDILQEQLAGLLAQEKELQHMLTARRYQHGLYVEEAKNTAELAAEGYVSRSRANEVERSRADMEASVANLMSELAKNRSSVASTRMQLLQQTATRHKDIDTNLAETQKNRKALSTKVESLRFDLRLAEIRAPVSGTVVGFKVNTVGGVISGGTVLMEIVPNEGKLIVEAEIPPNLIDKVHVGLPADLRFSAFNVTTTPVIPGTVKLIGADRLPPAPPQRPNEYYLAQIETTEEGALLLGDKTIQPGMPVDVIIKTGERTFLSYLLKPISDRFARSFKED